MMGVSVVGELNEKISKGKMQELLLISEALQEGRISKIAEQIIERGGVKFVMIAGPSSSRKNHIFSSPVNPAGGSRDETASDRGG